MTDKERAGGDGICPSGGKKAPAAEESSAAAVLFSDGEICVTVKPAGVLSEAAGPSGMPERLARALGIGPEEVYPVHRLDRETGGVMVYALNGKSAAALGESILSGAFVKNYTAAVEGHPEEKEGEWRDLLYHDPFRNRSYPVKRMRRGVREAVLRYRVVSSFPAGEGYPEGDVLDIRLVTGRTHQIRVQCASRRHPLLGDGRYGSSARVPMALWCRRISFPHPRTGRIMTFSQPPEGGAAAFLRLPESEELPEKDKNV